MSEARRAGTARQGAGQHEVGRGAPVASDPDAASAVPTPTAAPSSPYVQNVREWIAFEKRRGPLPLPESLPPLRSIAALLDERDTLFFRVTELEVRVAALAEACRAAIAYDEAIQVEAPAVAAAGKSWTGGDHLDRLYEDWIAKARAALAPKGGAR